MNIQTINLLLFDVISSIGSKIFTFACAFYILKNTHSPTVYTLYLTIIVLSTILSQPLFGVYADKYNNKKIVIISQIINVIALSVFICIFNHYFYYIILLGVILNLTDGAISIIVNANIKNISEKDIERFISLRQMYTVGIGFLAPILGGILIAALKIEYLALINVITELLAMVFIMAIKIDRVMEVTKNSLKQDFKIGFSYLLKNKTLLNFMLVAIILNFLINSVVVGVPITSIQVMKLSSQQFGVIESSLTIGMFIISLVFSIYPIKNKLTLPFQISIILQFLAVLILSMTLFLNIQNYLAFVLIGVVYFIIGSALPLSNIPYSIYLQNYIDEQYKGRVFSLNQSIVQSLTPVSFLVFGILLNYSQKFIYLIVSILILFVFIYFSTYMKKKI
ncbi:MFS transporter [Staphylococcus petrasii]|uniref:MFS transporter n=1 Tax=Staphylococcus petrasii TaxID=1276936 RepID=UPI000CCFF42F|nr:MFS transporter [Staphylococcus petrasii]PNZ80176.1 MFS transporter [Staphylococcus petrasii]TGA81267.1 MFS transporter [Staphylococcus petrasii]SUM58724.1 permease [Staphylococcus petrasii]